MTAAAPRLRLRISAAAERQLRDGHPWLFADSVREQNRPGCLGELAVIYDRRDRFLAVGLFEPDSPIRVRLLHAGKPQTVDEAWWENRLREAVARREGLFDAQTTGYRIVHGESDGWPGLVLDRYGSALVLKLYSGIWLPRLVELAAWLQRVVPADSTVLRLSRNLQSTANAAFGLFDGMALLPAPGGDARIEAHPLRHQRFLESGLWFEADLARGQKTGFFLDQRENRRQVELLARERTMLNAFSFSGGFSVYAARGGARSVTDLDLSPHALAAARRNLSLNREVSSVGRCRQETVQADAFDWLEQANGPKFDLIVLDPPSLARREAERSRAIQAYARLTRAAVQRLQAGESVLVAASCSAHVSADEFFATVLREARRAGRPFRELERRGHPPDHPANFPEAAYLKGVYLEFGRKSG
jgi:23S rRNA (cytosine1962-C5)-methyltransferase